MYVTVCERIFDMFRGLQLETIQDSRECLHANLRFSVEFLFELRNHVSLRPSFRHGDVCACVSISVHCLLTCVQDKGHVLDM
jgi:hypothetical protein